MNRDRTGPEGKGPMTGRGLGRCGRPRRYVNRRRSLNSLVDEQLLDKLDELAIKLGKTRTEVINELLAKATE